jgi:hypothetical protein
MEDASGGLARWRTGRRLRRDLLVSLHSSPDTFHPLLAPEIEEMVRPVLILLQPAISVANTIELLLLQLDAVGVGRDMGLQEAGPVFVVWVDAGIRSYRSEMPACYR